MKLLDVNEQFFFEHGFPRMAEAFPNEFPRMAFGLVGEGSECFGFDDDVSRDHDYGRGFYIWLAKDDFAKHAKAVQSAYEAMMESYDDLHGGGGVGVSGRGGATGRDGVSGRGGVEEIDSFYRRVLGGHALPVEESDWLEIPEKYLAAATNGRVFLDEAGEFSAIRQKLLDYYPESVWLKRMSKACLEMGQSGQYNYQRQLSRGEWVAGALAKARFVEASLQLAYLLNRSYCPFYKWAFRGVPRAGVFAEIVAELSRIAVSGVDDSTWLQPAFPGEFTRKVNRKDPLVQAIEHVCDLFADVLRAQGLSRRGGNIMTMHAQEVHSRIESQEIKELAVWL